MRLRPSGDSGLLVNSLEAFADYQRNEAWTWEHQALVRSRVVAGDPTLAARFATLRAEVLGRARDAQELRTAVRDMRERMRVELAVRGADHFDLKQDRGGIADIEFMVQYSVLAWAAKHPELLVYTDNVRLLERCAQAGLMAGEDTRLLADAYRAYRARLHRLTLQEESAVADVREFHEYREGVSALWRKLMEAD
jgi:glutamate-ammonia-ligase adenylyltransferase